MFLCISELEQFDDAMETLHTDLIPQVNTASAMNDVSGLLWMLKMADRRVDTQDFATMLTNLNDKITNHGSAYFATHFGACFIGAEDQAGYKTYRDSVNDFMKNYRHHDVVKEYDSFALDMLDSLEAFSQKDFALASSKIYEVRDELVSLGGSQTQRELYYRLMYTSLSKMEDKSANKRLLGLLNERSRFRELPPTAQKMHDQLKEMFQMSD